MQMASATTPPEESCIYENLQSLIVCLLSPVFILTHSRCLRLFIFWVACVDCPISVAYFRHFINTRRPIPSIGIGHHDLHINDHQRTFTSIMFGSRSRKESVSQGRSRKESVSKHRTSTSKHTKQPSFSQSSRKVEKLVQQARPVSQAPSSNATSPSLGR